MNFPFEKNCDVRWGGKNLQKALIKTFTCNGSLHFFSASNGRKKNILLIFSKLKERREKVSVRLVLDGMREMKRRRRRSMLCAKTFLNDEHFCPQISCKNREKLSLWTVKIWKVNQTEKIDEPWSGKKKLSWNYSHRNEAQVFQNTHK